MGSASHGFGYPVTKKPWGDHLAHPWLLYALQLSSKAWVSPPKIKEEKEITALLHFILNLSP
jgi:hypothetical protein